MAFSIENAISFLYAIDLYDYMCYNWDSKYQEGHMIKEIMLGDRTVKYDLQRKNVKNINIRVKRDLSIHISASARVPQREIDRILHEKASFILSALEKYEKLDKNHEDSALGADQVSVWGRILPISVIRGKRNQAIISGDGITVTLKDTTSIADKKKALDKALESLLREKVEEICREVHPKFIDFCPNFPTVKYRRMKSRWGSCNFKKNILTFNYSLIHAPNECVEYVVYHEFTHFIHPNHSADFYKELSKHIAEHATLRKQLNEISIKQ